MSELLALAVRCEQGSGPDRELADEILLACGWIWKPYGKAGLWYRPDGSMFTGPELPDPTASVDAAMAVVPEGCGWSGGRLVRDSLRYAGTVYVDRGFDYWTATAASAARAFSAAALRARAHLSASADETKQKEPLP